jgi:hypothetical protein
MTDKELLDLALEALRSAAAELYTASSYCNTYEVLGNTNDAITAIQQARAAPVQEPIGYLFQHEETGLTTVVDVQQVEWGFEKNNPRHQKIGPVYTTPPAQPAPVQKRTNYAVHLHHCNIGECEGVCKYGDDDCPALEHADMKAKWDRSTPPAAQRPWVGLTDEEISDIAINNPPMVHEFARAIEAKLKEKNT